MNTKIIAVVACTIMALMIIAPLSMPVKAASPAVVPTIQYRFFDSADSLFAALQEADSAGGVDSMNWPLTKAQYTTLSALPGSQYVIEPFSQVGEDEIGFNNNYTDGVVMDRRSPTNFTDVRNALNCLADIQGVIAGPTIQGLATQSYTQVPALLGVSGYINTAVSGANYPWTYNVTKALQILWTGGWYNHAIYPTLTVLLTTYTNGTLATLGGQPGGMVYSGNDPNGQWGGGDPLATVNSGFANAALKPLAGYVRTSDSRKDLGDYFCSALKSCGIPYTETYESKIANIRPYVLAAQTYNFATLGYTLSSPPNWWYSELTPAGIYPNGPNPYLVQDANTTYYATQAFSTNSPTVFNTMQQVVQYNLVWESYLIGGYSPATYCAYKAGLLSQIDIIGQGSGANGAQWENWIALNGRKNTTTVWNGVPPEPQGDIMYWGLADPPDQVNPIMQDTVYDFQVTDEIFTYPIGANPYTVAVGSAITGNAGGNDLPWMAYAWKTELVNDPYNAANQKWTNVTVWLRNDVTWQDGAPFTDLDINYTIYINSFYGDAYDNAAMIFAANVNQTSKGGNQDWQYQANPGDANYAAPYFTQNPSPSDPTGLYCCSILVSTPSWLNLYLPLYQIVPYHLYKYITTNDVIDSEEAAGTDGLHGLWPGEAAVAGNVLAGAPFTLSDLQNKPETTLVGTGPFAYRVGSTDATSIQSAGGGITLDAYAGFFMPIAPGAIAYKYTWLNTATMPSGGYFKVGLSDLVYLANAYGTNGLQNSGVPLTAIPGNPHTWNPAADLANPSGVIGLSDLVTLALHYGWYYGNYSYNAPYPPSEVANGGP